MKPSTHIDERFLVFSLCDEQYAIELSKVKEVIAMTETTPIPYAPSYFKGIMNLRGQVISVIDLRLKFKLNKAEINSETAIIILDLSPLCLGIIVNSVNSVMALNPNEIGDAPDVETSIKGDFLKGVARKDDKLILLLDIGATLNVEDLKAMKPKTEALKAA